MITTRAQDSFERLFHKAAQARLPMNANHACEIKPIADAGSGMTKDTQVVVLTISSIAFRLLLLLHFDENEATRRYYLNEGDERAFQEVFLEICNLCCGAMNQQLLCDFPDLGMSTPYVLSARCLPHLRELRPGFVSSYAVTLNDTVQLGATICVCAHAPIDFVAELQAIEETSGELELF
ncbi:MAG TPA: hypothetical protein VFE79_11955 [Paraburkholderia sp.]|nr:hypothetical protein [Paraburkholderia sp.]